MLADQIHTQDDLVKLDCFLVPPLTSDTKLPTREANPGDEHLHSPKADAERLFKELVVLYGDIRKTMPVFRLDITMKELLRQAKRMGKGEEKNRFEQICAEMKKTVPAIACSTRYVAADAKDDDDDLIVYIDHSNFPLPSLGGEGEVGNPPASGPSSVPEPGSS